MFLLFLSFCLDNEKERALDSVGGLNMANCGGLHNISLNQKKKKKKIKQEGKQENDLSGRLEPSLCYCLRSLLKSKFLTSDPQT
jgi:hypothetical protein